MVGCDGRQIAFSGLYITPCTVLCFQSCPEQLLLSSPVHPMHDDCTAFAALKHITKFDSWRFVPSREGYQFPGGSVFDMFIRSS